MNSEAAALALAQAIDAGRPVLRVRWTDREEQWRAIVQRHGALWAVPVEAENGRFNGDMVRNRRAARLQSQHYPQGFDFNALALPPSTIRIVSSEAHPVALYAAAREVIGAVAAMGIPGALTLQDIADKFPGLAAPSWLRDFGDGDLLDFAMDAAGYAWTSNRFGRAKKMTETNYIFVKRSLSFTEQAAAIKARKQMKR
jgi:hypothetical protein